MPYPYVRYIASFLILVTCLTSISGHAADRPPAETWITNGVQFPKTVSTNLIGSRGFENLHAEAVAGRILIFWKPELWTPTLP